MSTVDRRLRVAILPFGLPRYRVPVFRILAAVPDFDVKVVYGRAPGLENVPGSGFTAEAAKVWRIRTPFGYVGWDASQWRYSSRRRADVAVFTWNTRYLSLVPGLLRARRSGVRTLLWGHGYSRRESRWRSRTRRLVASLADGVVFYSHRDADRYAAEIGSDAGVYVAQNSLDQAPIARAAASWTAEPDRLLAFRRDHNLGDGPILLFVSRYKRANRLELLLEAAASLREQHPGLKVVLVGDDLSGPLVEGEISRLGLGDSVILTGPIYGEDELAPWFLSADLFCYPSNLGLSAMHAMGYGLPVVTGDDVALHPPEREVVRDGETGRTFTEGDPASMAAVIDELLRDPDRRADLGSAGRRLVTDVYTIEEMAGGLERAIRGVAGR